MTDREAWEIYIKPAIDRSDRFKQATGEAPEQLPEIREPATIEDGLNYLHRLGVVGVPDSRGGKT